MKNILLVEDEVLLAMATSKAMERFGYAVDVAYSGEDAVALATGGMALDLILMDIDLGEGIDGPQAAQRILEKVTVPIVFLTGHSEQEMVEKVRGITRYGYIIKNSGDFVLRSSIEMAIELFDANRRLQEELAERKHAETALAESERRLQSIFRVAPTGIGVVRDRVLLEVNPRLCRMTGFGAEELVGNSARMLYPTEEEFAYVGREKYRQIADKGTGEVETRWLRKDGRIIDVLLASTPMDTADLSQGVTFTALDITERNLAGKALRENEEYLSTTIQSIGDGVIATDTAGAVTRMNGTAERLTGWASADALGRPLEEVFRIVNADTGEAVASPAGTVLARGGIVGLANHTVLLGRNGARYQIADSAAPIRDENGAVKGVILVFSDVTEKYRAQEIIRESERRMKSIVESSPMGMHMYELDSGGRLVFVGANPAADRILGTDNSAFKGMTIEEAFPPLAGTEVPARYRQVAESGGTWKTEQVEYDDARIKGAFEVVAFQTAQNAMTAMFFDITTRKLAEEKIRSLLAEKDLILKEVHHRIKNNMNTMIGLLSLQSGMVADLPAATAIQDAKGRLQSMGVLYDKLYRSENVREMSVREYLLTLAGEIVSMFPNADKARIEESVTDFPLAVKYLSTLGIIVNELITNSMKYAFDGRDGGVITLSASMDGGHARFLIGDDGAGIPESIDFTENRTFGLQLVNLLTDQLKGTIRLERGNGTRFILEFGTGEA